MPITFNTFLTEALKQKKAVFTFGRFNPPQAGHAKVAETVVKIAQSMGADPFIFLSRTQDSKKNPLTWAEKVKYLKLSAPDVARYISSVAVITPFDILAYLVTKGYTDVTMIVGQDRVQEFKRVVTPYLTDSRPDKRLDLRSFNVGSAGQRDPDAEGTVGISGSKMRQFAAMGDFKGFLQGCSDQLSPLYAKEMFNAVRRGLRLDTINECFQLLENHLDGDIRRENLPQFRGKNLDNFLDSLKDVAVAKVFVPMGTIKPTQTDFDPEKVRDIIRNINTIQPFVISRDGYILDGHHRWLAHMFFCGATDVEVYRVDLPIADLMMRAFEFLDWEDREVTESYIKTIRPEIENLL